ncbi:MAG TPA: N-acetylmuramoyl-L-alanine amidase [Candidatus Deferrimicrobiaceae bacterium]|nr:N-acetylmuramoyl-L-alanine amidase [Candidatus Deferrimicrobiaceae bacterium]
MRPARRRSLTTNLGTSLVLASLLTALVPAIGTLAAPKPIKVVSHEVTTSVTHRRIVPLPFNASHVSVRWSRAHDAEITVAFAERPNEFGEEVPVGHAEASDDVGDETWGAVLWTGGAWFVRITTDRPIGRLTVIGIDARADRGLADGQTGVASAATSQPDVISRAEWGADESKRFDSGGNEIWPPSFAPMQKAIVHHTAGRNDDPNPAATVRAIYHLYAVTRDFGDMGYNFLIDESGRIYEGRYSRPYAGGEEPTGEDLASNVVRGAHATNFNDGTVGIVLLGTFTNRLPTAAARSSLEAMLAWKLERHGLDPLGSSTYVNPVLGNTKTIPNISGHRQVSATACPGDTFFPTFPTLRQNVANRIAATTGPDNDATPPAVASLVPLVPDPTGSHTIPFGLIFSEPVTGLEPSDFEVGGSSGGWSVDAVTGSAASYTVTLSAADPADGTVELTLGAETTSDLAGLAGPVGPATATTSYAFDDDAPTVSLWQTPHKTYVNDAGLGYIDVTAVYSEPVLGFEPSDVVIGGTSHAASPWEVPLIFGSGAAYGFSVTNDSWTDGTLTFRIPAGAVTDLAGNPVSASNTVSMVLDASKPTTTAPVAALRSNLQIGTKVAVRLSWTGSDVGPAGIASFEVARSRDGGAFKIIATGLSSAARKASLKPGHTYRFEVRARDKAGNVGPWKAGPTLRPKLFQQTKAAIVYRGTWRTGSSSAYSGGSVRFAKVAGAKAKLTTRARSLAFVTTRGPNRGAVKVYVDGSLAATIDLYAPTRTTRYVAFSKTWSSVGYHTIKIVVVGTAGRPRVDVDAFEVLR